MCQNKNVSSSGRLVARWCAGVLSPMEPQSKTLMAGNHNHIATSSDEGGGEHSRAGLARSKIAGLADGAGSRRWPRVEEEMVRLQVRVYLEA
ncbi:unnamed protein product [Calypogeia fissa]